MDKPKVIIYTDGAAEPNPGPGGWGAVVLFEKDGTILKRELRGGEPQSTNNRMEITAAIEALNILNQPCTIEFFTDSEYVKKGISEWMTNWKKTNFKNGKIQNTDLWKRLDELAAKHEINWQWVRGHAGNEYNERADTLASMGRAETLGQPVNEQELDPYRIYLKASGMGTWAALLEKGEAETMLSGVDAQGVVNRLYILAAVAALEAVPQNEAAHIFTDSEYLRDGIKGWIKDWKRNGWKTKDGNEVKYKELWEKLDHLTQTRSVKWSSIVEDLPQLKLLSAELKKVGSKNQLD